MPVKNIKTNILKSSSYDVSSWVICGVTHQPAAVVRRMEKWGDTVEKATELCLGLLARSSLKYKHIYIHTEMNTQRK